MSAAAAFAVGAVTSSIAAFVAARLAPFAGLTDDPAHAPDRKSQRRPVPAVGGIAILVGLAAMDWIGAPVSAGRGATIACLLAFALGLADDGRRGGLSPVALLLGQSIVAAALVASGWRLCDGDPTWSAAASFTAVLVALNALNTFDNADGAATSIGILGLALGAPLAAAPLAGFLPWNLFVRRGGAPIAYLGNSGSLLLALLLLLDPIARWALCLPALDLARLALVRVAAGSRPWIGDRRHLAHRLQSAGFPAWRVATILTAIAAPAVVGARLAAGARPEGYRALLLGLLVTVLLFGAALRFRPRSA